MKGWGMSLFLVDDQGETWRGDSRQLRIAYDTPFSGGEFIDYAIRNLGFAAINLYGSSCQIRLRPTFIAPKAYGAVIDWLRRTKVDRAVITVFESAWRDELVQTAKAVGRLEQIVVAAQPARHSDFLSKTLPAEATTARPLLADLLASWPHLVDNYTSDALMRLVASAFDQRYVAVKQSQDTGKLVFHRFGDGIFSLYDVWRSCAVGAPLEEQPDRAYGRWIASAYRDSIGIDTPRQDAVDAIVRCPVQGGRLRFRYRRVMFPMPSNASGLTFLAGSFVDNAIDLRVPSR